MELPPLFQTTGATVKLLPQLDRDGGQVVLVLIKQRFELNDTNVLQARPGAEVRLTDEPWDPEAPATSSVRYPADVCVRKPSTDVLVVGSVMAPGRVAQRALDVSVRVGPVHSRLRVFGRRAWYKGLTGLALSEPLPFREVPLQWELAYGGFEETRNPVGRGLVRDPETLVNTEGPAIEDPRDLIKNHRSRPAPAGVGPLGRHWMPRRQYVGTLDERWQRERLPLLPLDFDDRHNQAAPPPLISPQPLRGGEPVELVGLCEDGPLSFVLPRWFFHVGAVTARGVVEHRPMLDTVLLEPNARRVELSWRSVIPWPVEKGALRSVRVAQKELR